MGDGEDLVFLLHDVARLMRVEFDKRARMHDMTLAQWKMLLLLDRQPGLSQKELAEASEVEPITVARLLDRLEARGMVERRPDPRDRRIWRLHLRPAADPILTEIGVQRDLMQQQLVARLPEPMRQAMADCLNQMKTTLCAEMRGREKELV